MSTGQIKVEVINEIWQERIYIHTHIKTRFRYSHEVNEALFLKPIQKVAFEARSLFEVCFNTELCTNTNRIYLSTMSSRLYGMYEKLRLVVGYSFAVRHA